MDEVLARISAVGVVPVIVIDEPAQSAALVGALRAGGLPVAEITFRAAGAADAIRAAVEAHPDVLVGAGSVLTVEQVDAAIGAGASFVVSPGLEEHVVERTMARGVTALPGCATASDLMRARRLGLDAVKLFPAEAIGGLPMLQALAAPFPGMRFVPTGGIGPQNLELYLSEPRVLAVGGSWMVKGTLVQARDWSAISRLTREAADLVARARAVTP